MTVAASTRVALPAEPYPGLRPFEPKEHRIFFGREEMIDTVIDALARKNLVVVHGASGSGKSSFVRAGVLPWLEIQQSRRRHWLTKIRRPAGGPLRNLASAWPTFLVRRRVRVRRQILLLPGIRAWHSGTPCSMTSRRY